MELPFQGGETDNKQDKESIEYKVGKDGGEAWDKGCSFRRGG